MTIQEIIALGNMGYTKEDIAALSGQTQPVQQAQPVVQQAQPVVQQAQPVVKQAQPVVQQAQPVVQQTQPVQQTQSVQQPDFLEALKLLGQMQQIQTPSINAAQPTQTQPAQPVQTTQPVVQQAQPVVQQAQPTISLTADDLVKLTQGIAVKTAAGSVETPRSANDIILGMLDAYESTTKED